MGLSKQVYKPMSAYGCTLREDDLYYDDIDDGVDENNNNAESSVHVPLYIDPKKSRDPPQKKVVSRFDWKSMFKTTVNILLNIGVVRKTCDIGHDLLELCDHYHTEIVL